MNKYCEDEPEDAGLIQSKPPTKKELREISHFIAQSKQRSAARLAEIQLPANERKPPQKKG